MSDAPRLLEDADDLVRAFDEAGVDYLVVGAHALAAHGVPRATGDFDVWVRPTTANAERVVAALRLFGAPLDAHGVSAADFATPGTVYQLGLPPRRIDVLTHLSGLTFDEAWPARLLVTVAGRRLPVLGRDALIANKLATGREKDRLDVEALRRAPRG